MKKLILLLLVVPVLVIAQSKQKPGVTYDAEITRVIDGDTVAFRAPFLPAPLKPELSIRVFGVDTPEKGHRAQCESENARGQAAPLSLKMQLHRPPSVRSFSWIGTSTVVVYWEMSF
jgi:endonuclease YncB( thermonuclease family)